MLKSQLSRAFQFVFLCVLVFGVICYPVLSQQYTEWQKCKPAEFKEPDVTSGRYCALEAQTGACWGYTLTDPTQASPCLGMEQSSITAGSCGQHLTSKIECRDYIRTITNYTHKKVTFSCELKKDQNGNIIMPRQCVCYYTQTNTSVAPLGINDCMDRNFP